jgi:hypothetical protein
MKFLKQGEAKTLTLTITDDYGAAVDLSSATLALGVKLTKRETSYAFEKIDSDFNKTLALQGVVSVFLTSTDTNLAHGIYVGELKVTWPGSPVVVEKTADIELRIIKSVITT